MKHAHESDRRSLFTRSIVFDFNLHTPHLNTGAPSHLKGYMLAAAAAVLWGFSGVVTKYLLRRQMRPDELLVFRTLIAAAILIVWLGLKSPQLLKVRRADILSLILLGVVGLTARPDGSRFRVDVPRFELSGPLVLPAIGREPMDREDDPGLMN